MKPLLSKTTRPFLIFVMMVLVISIPVYYFVVDAIWLDELDEHNEIVAEKTSYEFNRMKISDENIRRNISLWNKIQPGTNIEKVPAGHLRDSVFTTEKYKPFSADTRIERYRCLKKIIYIKNQPYLFTIETNIEETEGTVMIIGLITLFFFLLIVTGLFILNRRLSKTIWKPFRDTLDKLKNFNLYTQTHIEFEATDTTEFEELNQSLKKLITHNVSVYKTQKEFTENASHELQTPLAILKNKLDLLLQDENLTDKQYDIAEEMNRALTRSSRINKNLLLLAKIDNSQFDNAERIQFDELLHQSMELFSEHFEQKNISVTETISSGVLVYGNRGLAEVLINNLILNAIRHTLRNGSISVHLTDSLFEVANSGNQALNTDLLFKRFSKLSGTGNGSGLGLAIIREICKFHHWSISYTFENNLHIFSVKL
ncbi:HAMP domain-containing sensor histidine kinase [Chryseobacterium fluminis]|uniref:sensor histidine kinase n=1 Tax=Chryseobacterium fluminis TaxID=2983606 RepID=UPI0022540034|nr:HAMP domain-containing sensor histidine kinase [Chryseobacterium sp. MMS21-Ot14]UZT98252.1 HAMP domain-containing sensor histidine kinase [Chryseobacterium sp. MMS21-Ot14]